MLYRGFLLAVLIPHIGALAAISSAALAYGLAHGYKSPRQLIGTVAAFIFTIAYYLTESLWWPMLIHAGMGMLVALAAYKVASSSHSAHAPAS